MFRGGFIAFAALLALAGCGSESDPAGDGSGGGAGGASGSGGAGGADATYPGGPYGVDAGDTVANLSFVTLDGATMQLADYHEGEQDILLLYATATWCFTCLEEVTWLNDMSETHPSRVAALGTLLEDKEFNKADVADADEFIDGFGVRFPIVLDADGALDDFRDAGVIPVNLVIDTKTMKIVHQEFGFNIAQMQGVLDEQLAAE